MVKYLSILMKKWGIDVLRKLNDKPMRYGQLQEIIGTDPTLSKRLTELLNLNLIERCLIEEETGRAYVGYTITDTGSEILDDIEETNLKIFQSLNNR